MIGVWLWDYEEPSEIMANAAKMVHEIWVPSTIAADAVAKVTDRQVVRVPIPPSMPARATIFTGRRLRLRWIDRPLSRVSITRPASSARTRSACSTPFVGPTSQERRPHLVIGTSNADRYPLEHARLVDACADHDVSVLNDDDVASGWLFERASDAVAYVSLHRSEGTGLFLTRAMLLGVATIVSHHSFGDEYFGARDSFQIPCSLVSVPAGELRGVPTLRLGGARSRCRRVGDASRPGTTQNDSRARSSRKGSRSSAVLFYSFDEDHDRSPECH